jgi:hypothetical protein
MPIIPVFTLSPEAATIWAELVLWVIVCNVAAGILAYIFRNSVQLSIFASMLPVGILTVICYNRLHEFMLTLTDIPDAATTLLPVLMAAIIFVSSLLFAVRRNLPLEENK